MSSAITAIIIWTALTVLGIVTAGKKKQKLKESQVRQKWEDILKMAEESVAPAQPMPQSEHEPIKSPEPVAAEGSLEVMEEEPGQPAKPAPAIKQTGHTPAESKMDFDPEAMIVYSEIMKPGYEKY